ncbi:MAG: hypothetical protein QGH40_14115, partial [bacterium]|nr:hypothetical protein [bacterium]
DLSSGIEARTVDVAEKNFTEIIEYTEKMKANDDLDLLLLVQQQLETRGIKSRFIDFTPTSDQLVFYEKKMKAMVDTGATKTMYHATVTIDGERAIITDIDHKAYLALRDVPGPWSSGEKHLLMGPFIARNVLVSRLKEMTTEVVARIQAEAQSLSALSEEQLITEIGSNRLGNDQLGIAYYLLGEKYFEEHDLDRSFKAHETAARKYYDPLSMIKLANIYYWGSEAFKEDIPDIQVEKLIPADRKKAYFWIMSAFQLDCVRKRIPGLYGLFFLETLFYDSSFIKLGADIESWLFLKKRYPQIFDRYNIKSHF